jgi:DNA-binding MarR family transcriptional regulator
MIVVKKPVPDDILKDSILANIAAAYFSVGKKLERKTQCSATRGFILSTLRGGVTLNKNQIATQLGFDRTVVHRAIQSMLEEGLVSEKKAASGRAIHVHLTEKGDRYRQQLIKARRAADEKLKKELTVDEQSILVRLLKQVSEMEF